VRTDKLEDSKDEGGERDDGDQEEDDSIRLAHAFKGFLD
jgi:hypothetical protein